MLRFSFMELLMLSIKFKLVHENAKLPTYTRDGDACQDIRSIECVSLAAGETKIVKTGLKVQYIPDGYKISVKCRSGYAAKGIQIGNGVGTVDQNYRGEIGVILYNSTSEPFVVNIDDRIAQIEVEPVIRWVNELSDEEDTTIRGDGGFGSSGK